MHFCETFSCYFCPIVQCILYYICVQCLCVKRPLSLFCVCEILRRRLLCNKSEGCLFNFGRCSQNRLSTKRSTVGWNWLYWSFSISSHLYNYEKLLATFFRILKQTRKNWCTNLSRKRALFNFLIAWNVFDLRYLKINKAVSKRTAFLSGTSNFLALLILIRL